jgi:NAD(P)-dependent dehydrogenase (short-subunit alcohol dehydrogenase family)
VDEHGDLLPPKLNTLNVNLNGCIYTVKLGIHYLKKNPKGGSIVMTASGSSFTRFPITDYSAFHLPPCHFEMVIFRTNTYLPAISKHAVLGLLRSLHPQLHPRLPIRINAIAPSWTDTGIVSRHIIAALGPDNYQSADVVARSVTLLMADGKRHGELIYSECGRFREMEGGEMGFQATTKKMLGVEGDRDFAELEVLKKLMRMAKEAEAEKGGKGVATG